ncbi:MAG: hypothetical protein AAF330_04655 [Pseudomonadota bacterium]
MTHANFEDPMIAIELARKIHGQVAEAETPMAKAWRMAEASALQLFVSVALATEFCRGLGRLV